MKVTLALALAVSIAIVTGTASEAALLLQFDENGNGTYQLNGGPSTPLPFIVAQDPGPGGLANALIYLLPTTVTTGDVPICESGLSTCTSSQFSDLLRFEQADGTIQTGGLFTFTATQMVYYSDSTPGDTDLADVGFPSIILQNGGPIAEIGPEGNNFFDWRPDGVPYPFGNEYIGISDAVPEPGTFVLVSLGAFAAGIFVAGKRRREIKKERL